MSNIFILSELVNKFEDERNLLSSIPDFRILNLKAIDDRNLF